MRTLCILGGEPLADENLQDVSLLIGWCKHEFPDLKVYLWTGYTIEELEERCDRTLVTILHNITCLIDGRFELEHRDTTLALRGSPNQRIIMMEDYYAKKDT